MLVLHLAFTNTVVIYLENIKLHIYIKKNCTQLFNNNISYKIWISFALTKTKQFLTDDKRKADLQ